MKNFSTISLVLLIALALALATFACKEPDTPKPHESTITAFGKTAKVIGDSSISTADFNTAVENLREALVWMDDLGGGITADERAGFVAMMGRIITIAPNGTASANAEKALVVGVGWLKSSTKQVIGNTISDLHSSFTASVLAEREYMG